MATESVSGTRTSAGRSTVSQTNSNVRRTASASSGSGARATSSQTQSNARQVINVDGRSFDRYAPRGTYLNIFA